MFILLPLCDRHPCPKINCVHPFLFSLQVSLSYMSYTYLKKSERADQYFLHPFGRLSLFLLCCTQDERCDRQFLVCVCISFCRNKFSKKFSELN